MNHADRLFGPLLAAGIAPDSDEARVCAGLLNSLGSPRSARTYARDLADWTAFCQRRGLRPLAAGRDEVQAYLAELRDATRPDGRARYAPDSRRRMLSVVRGFYREAIERGRPGPNPAERLGRLGGEAEPSAPALTADEAAALLSVLSTRRQSADPRRRLLAQRDHLALNLLIWLGLRAAELTALRVGDVGREGGHDVIRIAGKGGTRTRMKLTPALRDEIGSWVHAAGEAGLALTERDPLLPPLAMAWPPRPRRSAGLIVPLATRTVWDIVDRALAAIGRTDRRSSPHLLRKTSATLVWQGSHDLVLTQRHLRHKLPTTTERHYIKPAAELDDTGVDYIRLPTTP